MSQKERKEDYNKKKDFLRVDESDPVLPVVAIVAECGVIVATIHALVSASIFGGDYDDCSGFDAYHCFHGDVDDGNPSTPYVVALSPAGCEQQIPSSVFYTNDCCEDFDDEQEPDVRMVEDFDGADGKRVEEEVKIVEELEESEENGRRGGDVNCVVLTGELQLRVVGGEKHDD